MCVHITHVRADVNKDPLPCGMVWLRSRKQVWTWDLALPAFPSTKTGARNIHRHTWIQIKNQNFSKGMFPGTTEKWIVLLSRLLSSLLALPPLKAVELPFFLPFAHSYSKSGIDFWYYPFCLSQIVFHFPLHVAEISPTNDYSYHRSRRLAWGREFSRSKKVAA